MDNSPFGPLINNAAMVVALVLAYQALSQRIKRQKAFLWQFITGFIVSGIGISVMFNPWVQSPGVIFDTRSVILGLSGFFFGTIPTFLAVVFTSGVRFWMGGSGALPGIGVIVSSGVIGLLWRHFSKKKKGPISITQIFLLGLTIHAVMLLWMLLLPLEARTIFFSKVALPVILIYPLTTALAGWGMATGEERKRLETEKEKSESDLRINQKRLESLVEILQNPAEDFKSFFAFSLEKALEFTGSKVGFISTFDEKTEVLKVEVFSSEAIKECQVQNPPSVFSLKTGGFWGEAIRQRKPIIANDFQAPIPLIRGFPPGHIEIKRILEVPIFRKGEIVGLIVMGNKEGKYEEVDAIQTGLLMEAVWRTFERLKAEEALKEKEEKLSLALETLKIGIWESDSSFNHFSFSNQALEILGIDPKEFSGKIEDLLSVVSPEDREAVFGFFREIRGKKHLFDQDFRIKSPYGSTRFIRATGKIIRNPQEEPLGAIGIIRDITELRKKEEEVERARTDFLLAVSHELKTPLFLMGANLELLKSLPPEDRLKEFLSLEETFIRNLNRLRSLIENLVDSQRAPAMGTHLNLKEEDLNSLIVSAVEELDILQKGKSLQIVLNLEPLPKIQIDKEAITRVLNNLLTNAIKFSPFGGKITVKTQISDGEIHLQVQDEGPGIPEEEIPMLFQPFSRSRQAIKSVIPGAGLGLYVSKILVEAHGGRIGISSKRNQGTAIWIRLPFRSKEKGS